MSEIKISNEALLIAQRHAKPIAASRREVADYHELVTRVLAGDENITARRGLIIAAFVGLERLSVDDADAVGLVVLGLESLGVEVTA